MVWAMTAKLLAVKAVKESLLEAGGALLAAAQVSVAAVADGGAQTERAESTNGQVTMG